MGRQKSGYKISVQCSVTNSINIREKIAELGTLLTGDGPPITSTGAAKRALAVRSDSLTLAQTLPTVLQLTHRLLRVVHT